MTGFDLDSYLQRIGLRRPPQPDRDGLGLIVLAHAGSIAFENLDPFLGRPVLLDADSLQRKLVAGGRGGYCFEHNLLLGHALTMLGYETTGLAARVLWGREESELTPRTHMLLRVDIGGATYLVDVGFGGMTSTGVLALEPGAEQPTPHEPFRLIAEPGGTLLMQARTGERWRNLYRFDLQPQFLPDYEIANWYVSNHPQSHFVTGLSAARPGDGCRYALRNTELTEHRLGAGSESRTLGGVDELRGVLEQVFGLALPQGAELDERLRTLF